MVKEAIDMFIEGELWTKAKKCAADMAPKYVLVRVSNQVNSCPRSIQFLQIYFSEKRLTAFANRASQFVGLIG